MIIRRSRPIIVIGTTTAPRGGSPSERACLSTLEVYVIASTPLHKAVDSGTGLQLIDPRSRRLVVRESLTQPVKGPSLRVIDSGVGLGQRERSGISRMRCS